MEPTLTNEGTYRMKSFYKILSVVIAIAAFTTSTTKAQISVDQASSVSEVEALVEDVLLGSCVTVSNVNYIGPANASGTFDASGTTFTMQNGIILTTGRADVAIGPDDDNNAGVDQGRVGDADLTVLATETTYDAVILEFDFVPQDDTLRFNYVFASEEYPEWVNSEYNDVFGFFISGPGISGPYSSPAGFPNGSTNIALIPGTTTPVAINNVNNGYSANEPANGPCDNCAYYVENGSGPDLQYDGYTTVLTAQAVVTPCQTYHIRLAIADAGDHIYDSGVFLEAGSFSSGGGITVDFTNVEIEEGCSDEYLVFRRVNLSDNSFAIGATFSIGGTATMGVDYDAFPLSVSIPAGQDSVLIPINVPLDFTIEGTESIIVYMDQPPCDCLAPGSATINIIDNDVPLALTTTGETTICLGQSTNLTASVSGSLPPYTGSWNNGAPAGANVSVSPTNTTTYTYTVTDACNSQTQTSTETVTVIRPDFSANDQSQCLDGNSFSFSNTGATGGSVTHYWTFGDGNSSTNENPTHTYLADGDYTVTHYVIFTATNCTASANAQMTVFPEPTVTVNVDADVICPGGTDGALSASVSGGTAGYGYSWSPGGQNSPSISGVGVGTYTVTVTDANGCTDNASGTVVQNDPTPPTITCPPTANISTDAGLCTSSASIGTPSTSDNCGVATTVVDNAGPYSVGTTTVTWTVTDVNGNSATCTQDVVVTDDENPSVTCPPTANISTDAGLCT
ncbi:MAG: choice-of-anchor L domain-containing protein, partial [Flavobacteriales bacterium]|nr:choice-of-anchor L domain-containing protein [Flavobacteriales bacterium]